MGYCNFYKIKEIPFVNAPDLRYFYDKSPYSEFTNKIVNSVTNGKRLTIVVGGCGLGKTFISQKILEILDNDNAKYDVSLLVCLHSDIGAGWFLRTLALRLQVNEDIDEMNKYSLFEAVVKKYTEMGSKKKQVVILIDEANMIDNIEVFEEIRALMDVMSNNLFKLSVVLFGLPDLEKKLMTDKPLLHRMESKIVLKPLQTTKATEDYIKHRLKKAGAQRLDIFTDEAYKEIHSASHGNPRLINTICDNALSEGYLNKKNIIGEREIEFVVSQLGYNTRLRTLFLDAGEENK